MIHHGDLFDVLPTLAAESIDAVVTDPPYGIGFMGKEWDSFSPAHAEKKQGLRQLDKSPAWREGDRRLINPNLKGRTVNGAISSSQIDYDRSLVGQRGFQEWTARWSAEVFRVVKPGAYLVVCVAPRSHHRMMCGLEDAGFVVRDCFAWLFGSGFPKNFNLGEGKGTALKPAHEPIALAWKPFKGSIKACHETHGTAALNIDACRIEGSPYDAPGDRGHTTERQRQSEFAMTPGSASDIGRWPANVLLDEEAAALLDEQTGELVSGFMAEGTPRAPDADGRSSYGAFNGTVLLRQTYADRGGASRFYYVAKPSREERDFGTEGLTARQRDDSRKEGDPGGDNPRNRGLQPRGNFHPTVKPVELMRWLVKLVTPIGGTVLDPFTGSGTTGMACRYEHRQFIGIEKEADYVAIAERRIAAVAPLFGEASA
jgi:DNA modification methylase